MANNYNVGQNPSIPPNFQGLSQNEQSEPDSISLVSRGRFESSAPETSLREFTASVLSSDPKVSKAVSSTLLNIETLDEEDIQDLLEDEDVISFVEDEIENLLGDGLDTIISSLGEEHNAAEDPLDLQGVNKDSPGGVTKDLGTTTNKQQLSVSIKSDSNSQVNQEYSINSVNSHPVRPIGKKGISPNEFILGAPQKVSSIESFRNLRLHKTYAFGSEIDEKGERFKYIDQEKEPEKFEKLKRENRIINIDFGGKTICAPENTRIDLSQIGKYEIELDENTPTELREQLKNLSFKSYTIHFFTSEDFDILQELIRKQQDNSIEKKEDGWKNEQERDHELGLFLIAELFGEVKKTELADFLSGNSKNIQAILRRIIDEIYEEEISEKIAEVDKFREKIKRRLQKIKLKKIRKVEENHDKETLSILSNRKEGRNLNKEFKL